MILVSSVIRLLQFGVLAIFGHELHVCALLDKDSAVPIVLELLGGRAREET